MFFKKYSLVLILSFLAVILFVIKINYKENYTINSINEPKINNIEIDINKYPLKNLLPYYGNNFTILEYTEPLVLKIKNNTENKELFISEMEIFFKNNKLDINSHKFVFEN